VLAAIVSGAVAGGLVAEHVPAWLPAVIMAPLAVVVIASVAFEIADTRAGPRRGR
jgi:predicted MFS family arabinose efflux permease